MCDRHCLLSCYFYNVLKISAPVLEFFSLVGNIGLDVGMQSNYKCEHFILQTECITTGVFYRASARDKLDFRSTR